MSSGSAMDALQSMETYLSTRPSSFPSVSSGIDWQYVVHIVSSLPRSWISKKPVPLGSIRFHQLDQN